MNYVNVWVVTVLFNFIGGPVFDEVIGVCGDSMRAFELLGQYDYERVVRSEYEEMTIEKFRHSRREVGIRNRRSFYKEELTLKYQIDGDKDWHSVNVSFTIREL